MLASGQETIALVVTHGQNLDFFPGLDTGDALVAEAEKSWQGGIANAMKREITRWWNDSKNAPVIQGDDLNVEVVISQLETGGHIQDHELNNVALKLKRIQQRAENEGEPSVDVIFVGHSRGGIFTDRLAEEIRLDHPDLANRLDRCSWVSFGPNSREVVWG